MPLVSLEFLSFVVCTTVVFYAIANPVLRLSVLIGSSLFFALSFFPPTEVAWPLALFTGALMLSVYVSAYCDERRRAVASYTCLGLMIILFLLMKSYIPSPFTFAVTVGVSYVFFRGVQLLGDLADGGLTIDELPLPDLLLFLISFLTFGAGPLQHYGQFRACLSQSLQAGWADVDWKIVLPRFFYGAIKLCVLTPALANVQTSIIQLPLPLALSVALACLAFLLYIYVSFGGYMDWMVSFGALLSFRLPENFNKPYLAENFLDLWNRWHITLSHSFRDYVFNPLLRLLIPLMPASRRIYAGVIGYLVVFFLLGSWHGNEDRFMIFGLALGFIAAATKWVQIVAVRWPHKLHRALDSAGGRIARAGLAIGLLAVACIFTWPGYDLATAGDLLGNPIRALAIVLAATALGGLFAALMYMVEYVSGFEGISRLHAKLMSSPVFIISATLTCFWMFHLQAPQLGDALVYYQRF